jgi:hypothetical protein
MRLWHAGLGFSLSLTVGLGFGCAAGSAKPPGTGGAGGGSATSAGGAGGSISVGPGGGSEVDSGNPDGYGECAKFSAAAKQAPAAMLFVLDRSASMSQQNKWGTAQLAVAQAIDNDAFDSTSLGLTVFPASYVPAPDCLCPGFGGTCGGLLPNGVACGFSVLPQVALTPAGTQKANAPAGVRHDIYQYLVGHSPETADPSDASPIYDSLAGAYSALKSYNIEKRVAVLITDGGFSCTSISSPQRQGYSDGSCNDWEYPDSVNTLINNARLDAQKPIFTFIVGVPGSDSHGEMQGAYATAPYSMRLALSTYAVSGSPDTVDPACDKSKVFSKAGTDPALPCHFDLSSGGAFNADALAASLAAIRGKALGCVYDLPTAPPGQTIDLNLVNVSITLNGKTGTLPKRSTPSDDCAADGCWDYTVANQVQLLGKTCVDVTAATDAKVDIYVGCSTVAK